MYLFMDLDKKVSIGEPVVIRSDHRGGVGAYVIGGEKVGTLSAYQPEGCLSYRNVLWALYNERVLCKVAIKCGDKVVLYTESSLFDGLKTAKSADKFACGLHLAK